MGDVYERIQWDPRLSVGVEQIDEDHKNLIRQYNLLVEHLARDFDPNSVLMALDFLSSYINTHFEREEVLMRDVGYPDLERHAKAHAHLKQMVERLYNRFQSERTLAVAEALASLAGEWLTHHILRDDRAIGDFIRARQVAKTDA